MHSARHRLQHGGSLIADYLVHFPAGDGSGKHAARPGERVAPRREDRLESDRSPSEPLEAAPESKPAVADEPTPPTGADEDADLDPTLDAVADNGGVAAIERQDAVESRAEATALAAAAASAAIDASAGSLVAASHQLRSPLNAIAGFATMLQQNETYKLTPDQCADYADYILQSSNLMLHRIEVLLTTAAFDCDQGVDEPRPVDVAKAVAGLRARLMNDAEIGEIGLHDRTQGDGFIAMVDERATMLALELLIRGAIERSGQGDDIFIRVSHNEAGAVEIAVRDYGAPIDRNAMAEAASEVRARGAGAARMLLTRGGGPAGGVAFADDLMRAQGGAMTLRGRDGEGALIVLTLPAPVENAPVSDQSSATSPSSDAKE